jgi:crossover junction endodeoxyribonuclease RuvC
MNCLGIDPGITGAVGLVNEHALLFVGDLPIHTVAVGTKTRSELDLAGLREMLMQLTLQGIDHVILEQVGTRPGEGRVSAFKFGYTTGAITGLVAGLQLPYTTIRPQQWQKLVGCGPSPDEARRRCTQLYPTAASHLTLKKHAGRADSLLLAHAGLLSLPQMQQAAAE